MKSSRIHQGLLAVLLIAGGVVAAPRTAREMERHSVGFPEWTVPAEFRKDVFMFARIEYSSPFGGGYYYGSPRWAIDAPDSDLNLSYRLQQMTSLKVDPDGRIFRLTDPDLWDHPFIYIVEPGGLHFTEDEVKALRKFLLNGGFLMVDDFWGEREWENWYAEIKRVFPDREPQELEMDHPIFHCVFDLGKDKQALQVPNVYTGVRSQYTGITWERDGRELSIRGIHDDRGRLMVVICHNTDNGDGWEREGESEYYFRTFSEKRAYPLGINVVFYAMTH